MRQTLVAALLLAASAARADTIVVSGVVTGQAGPLEDAIVCGIDWDAFGRVAMPEDTCATTGTDGTFSVETTLVSDGQDLLGQVTAAAPGHLTTDVFVLEDEESEVPLTVDPLGDEDNPDYVWWGPLGGGANPGCGDCHGTLVNQWLESRHSFAADDAWVLDLYHGTGEDGAEAAPGYRLDHDDAGECGACHVATASWEAGEPVALDEVPAEHSYGVYCETCHKIRDVVPGGGPGVEGSITLWRPSYQGGAGYAQFAFGPWPNVIGHAMLTSYSPLHATAQVCAGCHEYSNAQGVPVMDTYSDWVAFDESLGASPCQECHMRDSGGEDPLEWVVDDDHMRQMAAQRRDPDSIHSHRFFGGVEKAPEALRLDMDALQEGEELVVSLTTSNVGAAHRVPTGMPFREVVLVVSAQPVGGEEPLVLASGPVVSARGGDLAGLPGRLYAKSLGDAEGNLTFAFWDATQVLEDTRIATAESDEIELRFAIVDDVSVDVTARLVYRRASQSLAAAKGWETEDQEIGRAEAEVDLQLASGEPDAGDPDAGAEPPPAPTGCECRATPGAAAPPWVLLAAVGLLVVRRERRVP